MVHAYAQPFPSFGLFRGLDRQPLQRALCEQQQGMPGLSAQWHREVQIGCGLQNLGNSCYLNSVLQCLAHLPPLANLCLAKQHSCSCKLSKENRPCICCTFERQVYSMLSAGQHSSGYRGAISPTGVYNSVHHLNKNLQRGRQEDSHELLRSLVDAMERNLLRQAGNYNPQRPPRHPRTVVNQLFGGILQNQVRCLVCGHASRTWDPCMDLSLELGGSCSSVEEALMRFTAVEKLDGDNKYRCEGCKQLVPAHKQLTLYDDPNVLVIHLKRFDGIFGAKISRDIAFSETLDIEPYMCSSRRFNGCNASGGSSSSSSLVNGYTSNSSSSLSNGYPSSNGHSSSINNQCSSNGSSVSSISRGAHPADSRVSPGQYELHGVVVHHGFSANSGHYLAYVKDGVPPTGHWHCMNDSQVYRVNVPTVLKQQAYILFYVRTVMKQQARLPQHTEQDAAQPSAVAGRLKRSSIQGEQQQQQQQQRMIGPQLPPHLLAKRQKLQEEQQSAAPQPRQQQHPQPCGPVYGPQLPPWYSSRRQKANEEQQEAAGTSEADQRGVQDDAAGGKHVKLQQQQHHRAGNGVPAAQGDVKQQQPHHTIAAPNPWTGSQQQQQQQQQQQHQGDAAPPEGQQQQQQVGYISPVPSSLCDEIRVSVDEGVRGCAAELKAWLTAQLTDGKQQGVTYEQSRELYFKRFRKHPLWHELAVQCMQTLCERLLSSSSGCAAGAAHPRN